MLEHDFFGKIECHDYDDWKEFYATKTIQLPHFEEDIYIRLVEYDEDLEPLETPPTPYVLDEYANTLTAFIEHIDAIVLGVQALAFERYQNIYAKYYEKAFEVIFENEKIHTKGNNELHDPLNIQSKEAHFEYMRSGFDEIILSNDKTVVMPFRYLLDEEHGLECKIIDNQVVAIGGIAETIYQ